MACSNERLQYDSTREDAYLHYDHSVRPIVVPTGATTPDRKPYYLVPNLPVKEKRSVHFVSLLPPGHNMSHFDGVVLDRTQHNKPRLLVAMNARKAWRLLDRILAPTPYQILHSDFKNLSYSVLDTEFRTNKNAEMSRTTSVYRIQVKALGSKSAQITVLALSVAGSRKPSVNDKLFAFIQHEMLQIKN